MALCLELKVWRSGFFKEREQEPKQKKGEQAFAVLLHWQDIRGLAFYSSVPLFPLSPSLISQNTFRGASPDHPPSRNWPQWGENGTRCECLRLSKCVTRTPHLFQSTLLLPDWAEKAKRRPEMLCERDRSSTLDLRVLRLKLFVHLLNIFFGGDFPPWFNRI